MKLLDSQKEALSTFHAKSFFCKRANSKFGLSINGQTCRTLNLIFKDISEDHITFDIFIYKVWTSYLSLDYTKDQVKNIDAMIDIMKPLFEDIEDWGEEYDDALAEEVFDDLTKVFTHDGGAWY